MQASVKIVDWEPGAERQARPALQARLGNADGR